MPEEAQICFLFVTSLMSAAVGSLILAVFLRLAVFLVNKVLKARRAEQLIPEPLYGRAVWISFVACVSQLVISFLISYAMLAATNDTNPNMIRGARLVSFFASLLALVCVFAAMLPSSLLRSFFVTVLFSVTQLVIAGGLFVIIAYAYGMKVF